MGCVPCRYQIAIVVFLQIFTCFMIRTNSSILLIAMTEEKKKYFKPDCRSDNITEVSHISKGKKFNWEPKWIFDITGSYYYGYLVGNIIFGPLCDRFGSRRIVPASMILNGLIDISNPFLATIHPRILCANRVLNGFLSSTIMPAMQVLYAKWSPPKDRIKMNAALFGNALSTIGAWPICSYISMNFGYIYGYCFTGSVTILMAIVFIFLVYDTPTQHPWISEAELEYIHTYLPPRPPQKKTPPFKHIFTSLPFYGCVSLVFGSTWGLFFMFTTLPLYMKFTLGYNLSETGLISCLPPVARFVIGVLVSMFVGVLKNKWKVSNTFKTKFFSIISHLIPGLLIACMSIAKCNTYLIIGIDCLALALSGWDCLTSLLNTQDLAPNFTGTIFGISNAIGTVAGIVVPQMVRKLTDPDNTLRQWRAIYWLGGCVYIGTAMIFWVLGSGEVQPWNFIYDEVREKLDKEEIK